MGSEQFERYDLSHRIAVGGMGEVYVGRAIGEHGLEKAVAVKRILPTLASDPAFVARFINEAKLSVSLSHANLVQVFDLGSTAGELFLIMEYVHGADVQHLIDAAKIRGTIVPVGIALFIMAEALRGLAYAHERVDAMGTPGEVIHCDISPSNLLVSYSGEVKLADFGIAAMRSAARATKRSVVRGKPRYMAPEQREGTPPAATFDLYALGVVIRDILCGADANAVMPLCTLRPDVPPELQVLVERTMSPRRRDRPESARAMLAEILGIMRGLPQDVSAPDLGTWVRDLVPPVVQSEDVHTETMTNDSLRLLSEHAADGTTVWKVVGTAPDIELNAIAPRVEPMQPKSHRWIYQSVAGVVALVALVAIAIVDRHQPSVAAASEKPIPSVGNALVIAPAVMTATVVAAEAPPKKAFLAHEHTAKHPGDVALPPATGRKGF